MKLQNLFLLPLVAVATLTAPRFAEAGCLKTENDPFTGEMKELSGSGKAPWPDYNVGGQSNFSFQRAGDKLRLHIDLLQSGVIETPLPNENAVKFSLDGGTIIELTAIEPATPEQDTWGSRVFTRWPVVFEITEQQLLDFANARATAIMIPLGGQGKVWELDKSLANVLKSSARCVAKKK